MKILFTAPLAFLRVVYQSVWLALSQIWANKTRSILTTLGIVIGVASVTAVIAALSGLKAKVLADFETFGTKKIYVQPSWPDRKHISWKKIRFTPRQFEGLLEHCPSVERFTMIAGGGEYTVRHGKRSVDEVRIRGVQAGWVKIENRTLLKGRPFSIMDELQGQQVCLITPKLQDELHMDKDCIGQSMFIGVRTFRIVGVLEEQPNMFINEGRRDNIEVYIPFNTNRKMRSWLWPRVIAESKSTEVSEEANAEITFFLRRSRNIRPGDEDTFRVHSIESELKKFKEIAGMITLVASGIVGISLLVGGVGIMNIMLVSVSERTREIGLRKAVGAKNSAIMIQFLVEAVVLCFIGGIVGVGFGHLLTIIISKLNPAMDKTYIPMWAIVLSFAFSGFVGIFFGMFPAIKAARLDPIEALRHE